MAADTAGRFEFLPYAGTARDVSEEHAKNLLDGHVRNVAEALDRMRANPWGQIAVTGGTVRYILEH